MTDDPIDVDEMIAAYRALARPSPAVKRRVAAALEQSAARPDRRWVIAAVAIAAAAVLVLVWRMDGVRVETSAPALRDQAPYHDDASEQRATSREPAAAVPPVVASDPDARVVAPAVREAPRATPTKPRARTEEADARSAAAEMALLERVRADLEDGRVAAALAGVERHAREFPDGLLGEERDALRVLASCRLRDRRAAALELRREFLRRHPRSTYAERVRAACEETNNP